MQNVRLILCGPEDIRDPIKEHTKLKICSNVKISYIGEVEDTELYYSLFSLFILPSYREGLPTVVLEASAMELPIITTKCTGCIDSIIENQTGIFTSISPESISDSLFFYYSNYSLMSLHGRNGRKFVQDNFSRKIVWNHLKHFLK